MIGGRQRCEIMGVALNDSSAAFAGSCESTPSAPPGWNLAKTTARDDRASCRARQIWAVRSSAVTGAPWLRSARPALRDQRADLLEPDQAHRNHRDAIACDEALRMKCVGLKVKRLPAIDLAQCDLTARQQRESEVAVLKQPEMLAASTCIPTARRSPLHFRKQARHPARCQHRRESKPQRRAAALGDHHASLD